MKAAIFMPLGLIFFMFAGETVAAEIPREPLDRLWEQHMLQGKGGLYTNGRPEAVTLAAFEDERRNSKRAGSPFLMGLNEYSISVDDFRGTRLLGLLQGGGWTLGGGLLERIEISSGTLELWGKIINRVYPGLWDNYYRFKEDQAYDFFLVYRTGKGDQGKILRKWKIQPEQVRWFVPERAYKGSFEVSDVRGYLDYDTAAKTATVKITGLTTPFSESLNLSGNISE